MSNVPIIFSFIKTDCGRSKYYELISRKGVTAKIRLLWFILIAIMKDWNIKAYENNT